MNLVPHKDLQGVIASAALNLGLKPIKSFRSSPKTAKNLGKVLLAIAATEPEMVAALGQALPQYRWQLAANHCQGILDLSRHCLGTAADHRFGSPGDHQSIMVVSIARIYSYKITPQRATELV